MSVFLTAAESRAYAICCSQITGEGQSHLSSCRSLHWLLVINFKWQKILFTRKSAAYYL
ncbi:MAG: hypothetical protein OFPII_17300 [Osedax symbiont Rs1]|nr:MAG: hypothetical protein OFPII_17300 [Osedax symbiont Rs1]